jgi:hypothetical protein
VEIDNMEGSSREVKQEIDSREGGGRKRWVSIIKQVDALFRVLKVTKGCL